MTGFEPNTPIPLTKPASEPTVGHPTAQLVPQAAPPVPTGYPPVPTGYPPVPTPAPYGVTATTVAPPQSNVEIILAWIFTALTLLYMLPWAIAATRRSTNSVLIAVATFFLAWTGVGWLVLLVLSCVGPTVYSMRSTTTFVAVPPPPPAGMWAHCPSDPPHVRRWWDGYQWTPHTTAG